MWEIAENLHRADLTKLERDSQVAEWIELSRQSDAKGVSTRGRPESGTRRAARELGLSEPDARRAVDVASLTEDAKATARELGLDNNRSVLIAAAKADDAVGFLRDERDRREKKTAEEPRHVRNVTDVAPAAVEAPAEVTDVASAEVATVAEVVAAPKSIRQLIAETTETEKRGAPAGRGFVRTRLRFRCRQTTLTMATGLSHEGKPAGIRISTPARSGSPHAADRRRRPLTLARAFMPCPRSQFRTNLCCLPLGAWTIDHFAATQALSQ